jgi:hypothetical protein
MTEIDTRNQYENLKDVKEDDGDISRPVASKNRKVVINNYASHSL